MDFDQSDLCDAISTGAADLEDAERKDTVSVAIQVKIGATSLCRTRRRILTRMVWAELVKRVLEDVLTLKENSPSGEEFDRIEIWVL